MEQNFGGQRPAEFPFVDGVSSESRISELTRSYEVSLASGDSDNTTQTLLSPIRQIPPELLQKIFLSVYSSSVDDFHLRKHDAISESLLFPTLPLVLSRVCVSWRALAYATSELWSFLGVKLANNATPQSLLPKMLEGWLTRSGTHPITISLCTGQSDIGACLKTLALFSQRWLDVHFQMSGKWLVAFTSLQSSDVPILRSFDIQDELSVSVMSAADTPVFLRNAPSLRAIGIPHRTLPLIQAPNLQLTTLILRAYPIDYALGVIRKSPNLERLYFTTNKGMFWSVSFNNVDNMELPQLREMHVEGNVGPLLVFFRCPSLRLAHICGSNHWSDASFLMEVFNSFLLSSGCNLQDLTLEKMTFPKAILLSCFALVPTLTTLSINASHPTLAQSVLEALTTSPDDTSPLCPHLRKIVFKHCGAIPDEPIIKFLNSRCQTPGAEQLDTVEFINSTNNPISHGLKYLVIGGGGKRAEITFVSANEASERGFIFG